MRIFKVTIDSNNVQLVQPSDHSKITLELFDFSCTPRKDTWSSDIPFYVYNPKTVAKNFYSTGGGALVFDIHTLNICQTAFEMAGEILPVKMKAGENLYLLNVLECRNALDYDKTKWDYYSNGRKGRILEYAINPDRLDESTIFKIPESNISIFTYSDVKNPEDEFYYIYKNNNLTGLIFEEIYDDGKRIV